MQAQISDRLPSYLEQLNICIKEITLCDIDLFQTELMNQTQNAGSNGCFPAEKI